MGRTMSSRTQSRFLSSMPSTTSQVASQGNESAGQSNGSRVQCRYFLNGVCRNGSSCAYSHELSSSKPDMVCKFYLAGKCNYGDRCRYDHIKPATTSAPPRAPRMLVPPPPTCTPCETSNSTQWGMSNGPKDSNSTTPGATQVLSLERAASLLCPFAAAGRCTRQQCPYLHGLACPVCGMQCLHPERPETHQAHISSCAQKTRKKAKDVALQAASSAVECGICLERVVERPERTERRFGILENCSHAFCLSCIRSWRSQDGQGAEVLRACPVCRVMSHFVIPSATFVDDPATKQELIDDYQGNMKRIPCRHFNYGEGECPFGTSCFYLHQYRDGTPEVVKLRHISGGEDGKILAPVSLWDFIAPTQSQNGIQAGGEVDLLSTIPIEPET